jgi:hypothetical protein
MPTPWLTTRTLATDSPTRVEALSVYSPSMRRSKMRANGSSKRVSRTATTSCRASAMLRGSTSRARATGWGGSIVRKLRAVFSDDADHVRRYAEHLRAGHYVVGVSVGEDEATKESAADALRAAHALSLHYYADNYVEDLAGEG